jgi:N-terminal acetyltransferase B complex non-catalytic subunit
MLEDFVRNALRFWRVQMDIEGPEAMCASESVLIAIEALLQLFEFTARSQYYYQAATIARYSLLLDKNCQSRNMALLSTRLHLKLGLGTLAFEHYGRVQVKEMLHDNIAWVALSRISLSHPFGANGSKKFSPNDELKKVIATFERMENKVDEVLYADLQHFNYATAFDLLDLKRKLHTSLTKHFCIVERRRIARLARLPMDTTLAVPLRSKSFLLFNPLFRA